MISRRDLTGTYDTQYEVREKPDCRGRLRTGPDGTYGYRAIVPVSYPIPGDVSILPPHSYRCENLRRRNTQGPVGELLITMGRHNMRPNHLHMMIEAPGYQKLTTALYPEGDEWLASDAVFGVKKSLVVVRDQRVSSEKGT